jgi:hypothetical protein
VGKVDGARGEAVPDADDKNGSSSVSAKATLRSLVASLTDLLEDGSIVAEDTLDEFESDRAREIVEHEQLLLPCRRRRARQHAEILEQVQPIKRRRVKLGRRSVRKRGRRS